MEKSSDGGEEERGRQTCRIMTILPVIDSITITAMMPSRLDCDARACPHLVDTSVCVLSTPLHIPKTLHPQP